MAAKILVVDDEPSIVKLVEATLSSRGYEIFKAYDGQEAIVEAKLHKPDLILLDVMMPHMDGKEARKRLAADPATKDIPVLVMTAYRIDPARIDILDLATYHLNKPVTPEAIAEQVGQLIERKALGVGA